MSQDTRESGQPRKLYSHPITFPDELINMLGIAEGFSAFQHRLQFAEQMMSTIDYTLEGIRQKRHVNKLTKKEANVNFDMMAIKKMRTLFHYGVQLAIIRDPYNPHIIVENKILYPFDEINSPMLMNCEKRRLPSIRNLFPRNDLSGKDWSVEIQEPVLCREAFENEDPATLSLQGGFVNKFSDGTMPRFSSHDDIENSNDSPYHVSKHYYNKVMNLLFDEWRNYNIIVKTQISVFIEELRSFNFDYEEVGYTPSVTPLE